jgi:hypothetical protein|tara:strand:- start:378 stop:977 length:600 start_codon:yes stop_codon:yes gene_type:complete
MRIPALAFASFLLTSFLSPVVSAHEPKEYTILLTQEGTTPQTIPDDVLVQTDFLFFMNVDEREGVSHRIQFDADGDGLFNGSDDFSTNWLSDSCDLDENGSKVDESCMVTEAILLGPENGLLPGTIQLQHQIMSNSSISEENFSVTFREDVHNQLNPQVVMPQMPQEDTVDGNRDVLLVILFTSLMGILALSPSLITRD